MLHRRTLGRSITILRLSSLLSVLAQGQDSIFSCCYQGNKNAMTTMRAIRVSSFGGPEVLKLLADVPVPSVSNGQVSL